jgi:hypothetical protein
MAKAIVLEKDPVGSKRTARAKNDYPKAWVISVNMGLGHQRAANPLGVVASGGIITVGEESSRDMGEKKLWHRLRAGYEFLSRVRSVPLIGKPLFGVLDSLQNIPPFYPIRDLSHPTFQVRVVSSLIKQGICSELIEKFRENPLPLVTSYPVPALAADAAGLRRVYCIVCDAEISRAWVAENPRNSKIHYLAPCGRSVMRLKSYGVPDERIFLTGFPLPLEVRGDDNLNVLKADVGQRLNYLDPNNRFWPLHGLNVAHFIGKANCAPKNARRLTITYAVGGAGAQKEFGYQIVKSLGEKIRKDEVRVILVAGVREEVKAYFEEVKRELAPGSSSVSVIHGATKEEYFKRFAEAIRVTDILWTKPSELSFYCGLGIPIILSPTIGAQEEYNRKWLLEIQAGVPQDDPAYTDQWLYDLLREGRLADSGWDGFLKARKFGTYKIIEILGTGTMARETSPLKR